MLCHPSVSTMNFPSFACYVSSELKSLAQEMSLSTLPVMEHLDFSPLARQKPGVVDFTKLNNAGTNVVCVFVYVVVCVCMDVCLRAG